MYVFPGRGKASSMRGGDGIAEGNWRERENGARGHRMLYDYHGLG